MQAVMKTYDPVQLSFAKTVLAEAGIETLVLDGSLQYIEMLSSPAFRLMVLADDEVGRARRILCRELEDWPKVRM